jgi:hypothetical protein
MLWPISHFTWQLLRTVKRAKKKLLLGKDLRIVPSRRTKDGSFLDELVQEGLLEVASTDAVTQENKQWPTQFRNRYRLTEKGEHAAEYGEYEREVVRREKK